MMNRIFTVLDRIDDFMMKHPRAAMVIAAVAGAAFGAIVINLP